MQIQISGFELGMIVEEYIKKQLHIPENVELAYTELCHGELKNPHILNDDENEFTFYVEALNEEQLAERQRIFESYIAKAKKEKKNKPVKKAKKAKAKK